MHFAPLRKQLFPRSAAIALVVATAVTVVVVSGRGDDERPQAGGAVTTTPTPHDQTLKPPIRGLLQQFDESELTPDNPIRAFVVGVAWADLQPEQGGPVAQDNAIDRAIRAVRTSVPTKEGVRLKVRVLAGVQAPEWAKNLGGEPFEVTDPASQRGGTVGRFWTPEFGRAYAELHQALAARYDDAPEISEVTISRCTTVFAEPFLRQISHPDAADAYRAAGYTPSADKKCLREQIVAHEVWQRTRSGLALNPYQFVGPSGGGKVDGRVTEQMMRYCREKLRERCVLENNSIRWPPPHNRYTAMYAAMKRLGPPIAFQTAAPSRIGDPLQTVLWAIDFGADAVELGARTNGYTREELTELDDRLRKND